VTCYKCHGTTRDSLLFDILLCHNIWNLCHKLDFMTHSWWKSKLSVRNMVPTLTSSKRRGLSLNGRR
jgi:hypothetical protein